MSTPPPQSVNIANRFNVEMKRDFDLQIFKVSRVIDKVEQAIDELEISLKQEFDDTLKLPWIKSIRESVVKM